MVNGFEADRPVAENSGHSIRNSQMGDLYHYTEQSVRVVMYLQLLNNASKADCYYQDWVKRRAVCQWVAAQHQRI
jgi:hypothetical protein